eukprot:gnl/TRDRNA2_/TRDRNA2_189814_c0_seq1.p1 gnl/TRDRNA2_/TRDRNA2_189814_c0~~gnl/TRDRNA2_/TRDRNA2_189814_c0_seq1.p1  ORF type:complete len:373 (+),score=64.57 gnl/TRDRNA2_/TRDRNA2_189814_c0_seq1:124-1242(+)
MWRTISAATWPASARRTMPGSARLACISRSAGGLPRFCSSGRAGTPALAAWRSTAGHGRRGNASSASGNSVTRLGTFLEKSGAVWGEVCESHEVKMFDGGTGFSWEVEMPPERLATLRRGDSIESPPFAVGARGRGRFQLYPKGDAFCQDENMCSLWLWTDKKDLGRFHLRLGATERNGGASEFCRLEDVLINGMLEVSARMEAVDAAAESEDVDQDAPATQSLQLTGLQLAEWTIFRARRLLGSPDLVTSPPFRFHHVLLGDMYLEMLPGQEHAELCTLFFRCRVPTMKLRVCLSVGATFSHSFESLGRNRPQDDLKSGAFLQVNLEAPGVLTPEGDLAVRCILEEVVSIPPALQDMIPKLDERAAWPKRL